MRKKARIPECGHPDRKHQGHGLCTTCYRVNWLKANPEEYDKNKKRAAKWHRDHPERVRELSRMYAYGVSQQKFDAMLDSQGGRCAVCKEVLDCPHIDHDHQCCPGLKSCGKCVRGLLCDNCNRGLGAFHDRPEVLVSAAEYIKEWTK